MNAKVLSMERKKRPPARKAAQPGHSKKGQAATPRVLRCLFDEHRHLAALVDVLDGKAFQGERLQAGDFYLLRDIVGYLHDYPDEVHHPTENRLLEILVRRVPSRKSDVDWLNQDHLVVARKTQELLGLLDQAIEQPSVDAEWAVREACRDFAVHQRKHMQFENSKMFPAVMEALTADDFKQIESYFAAVDDPLFGDLVGKRYRLLYEYLLSPAERATEKLTGSRLFSMERLMVTIDILEEGAGAWSRRAIDLGRELVEESRFAADRTLHPENISDAIAAPVKYAAKVGRSVAGGGSDLLRIYATTLGKGVKAYFL